MDIKPDAVIEKRKDKIPYIFNKNLLKNYIPEEIAANSFCKYKSNTNEFEIVLMNKKYYVLFPDGDIINKDRNEFDNYPIKTLIIRYMLNAKGILPKNDMITYRDLPGGNLYFPAFEDRCIKKFAYTFNNNMGLLKCAMKKLGAEKLSYGDLSYKFEFINKVYIGFILWLEDDEFLPSAQIFFDSNIYPAFSTEDVAVIGEIFISELWQLGKIDD